MPLQQQPTSNAPDELEWLIRLLSAHPGLAYGAGLVVGLWIIGKLDALVKVRRRDSDGGETGNPTLIRVLDQMVDIKEEDERTIDSLRIEVKQLREELQRRKKLETSERSKVYDAP
jgi:hypothetical protein